MEQVIKAYGKFLLEITVVAILLGMLFAGLSDAHGNRGVFRMMGAFFREQEVPAAYLDFERFRSESEIERPSIVYTAQGSLHVGSYRLDELFRAADGMGQELNVQVRSISDPHGIERIGEYLPDILEVQFAQRGIYSLRVAARDAYNRTGIYDFRIPVND